MKKLKVTWTIPGQGGGYDSALVAENSTLANLGGALVFQDPHRRNVLLAIPEHALVSVVVVEEAGE